MDTVIDRKLSERLSRLGPPRIAPNGLLVDLIRIVPGEDENCISTTNTSTSLTLFVLGEWDLLRLTLIDSFFPRARDVEPWPPMAAQVQNHHSFIAHIWEPKAFNTSCLFDGPGKGFSGFFCSPERPITLLICLKLDPRPVERYGILAEWIVVDHVMRWSKERDIVVIPAGSVGWQELVFVASATSLKVSRELVREIFEIPASALFPAFYDKTYPLVTRSVTYPCISLDAYLDPNAVFEDVVHRARILLNIRPGLRNPFCEGGIPDSLFRMLDVSERFGEYDLALHLPPSEPLGNVISTIRALRETNRHADYKGWLYGTSTILEFESPMRLVTRTATFLPLGQSIAPEAIRGAARQFRWFGVDNLHSERLISILRRIYSYESDPFLSEAVVPLARYFSALGGQIGEAYRDLISQNSDKVDYQEIASQSRVEPLGIEVEPEDIEKICGLLEFTLRQRLEGIQQFLFNALPSSYYGRGGMNRLLIGADTVLQEVSELFDVESPGFVVFGMPDYDFASFGPIVVAPIPALFELEWWWLIFHEAAVYIDVYLFNPDALGPHFRFTHLIPESKKLVPDLLALALPFKFDLDLFSLMNARRLALVKTRMAEAAIGSVALRIATLHLLSKICTDLQLGSVKLDSTVDLPRLLSSMGDLFCQALERYERDLLGESLVKNEILSFIATFLRRIQCFSLSYRRREVPELEVLVRESRLFSDLVKQCQTIRSFWRAACESARRDDSRAILAIEYLVRGLLGRMSSNLTAATGTLDGEIPIKLHSIADLVYLALKRWERRVSGQADFSGDREVLPDIQDRLAESLGVWHLGVTHKEV